MYCISLEDLPVSSGAKPRNPLTEAAVNVATASDRLAIEGRENRFNVISMAGPDVALLHNVAKYKDTQWRPDRPR